MLVVGASLMSGVADASELSSAPLPFPVVDGWVNAVAVDGDIAWIGGHFTGVGPRTGPAAVLSAGTGAPAGAQPDLAAGLSEIRGITGDGAGGWYLAGQFNSAQGVDRGAVVHVRAEGALDLAFRPELDQYEQQLYGVARAGGTVAVRTFTSVIGLDAATGERRWSVDARGSVRSMIGDGDRLLVGGGYSTLGTQSRSDLGAIDAATGQVLPWAPTIEGNVFDLAVDGQTVYAVGDVSQVDGAARGFGAALDRTTGAGLAWNPRTQANGHGGTSGTIYAIAVGGGRVYIGGEFDTAGGAPIRRHIAALNPVTGDALPWADETGSDVLELDYTGGVLYAGGRFLQAGNNTRARLAAFDPASGAVTGWNPGANGPVSAIAATGGRVAVGGVGLSSVGLVPRLNLASVRMSTGEVLPFRADVEFARPGGASVVALATQGTRLYVAGDFRSIGGVSRQEIAAVDRTTGALASWAPQIGSQSFNAAVAQILVAPGGSPVYLGGAIGFVTEDGMTMNPIGVAAFDATTAKLTSFDAQIADDPNALRFVSGMALSGGTLYFGGRFPVVGGQPRQNLAAVDATTGALKPWAPGTDGDVASLDVADGNVYAGGDFHHAGGAVRERVAVFDPSGTGALRSFAPEAIAPQIGVNVVRSDGQQLLVAGDLFKLAGQVRRGLGAVRLDGTVERFEPSIDGVVLDAVPLAGGRVLAVGDFERAGESHSDDSGVFAVDGVLSPGLALYGPGDAPAIVVAPELQGIVRLGQEIRCGVGRWTGATPFDTTYAWLRDGQPIVGAAGKSYKLSEADAGHDVACRVTSANGSGSATATSAARRLPDTVAPLVFYDPEVAYVQAPDPAFTFRASEPGVTFECRIDDGAFVPCTSPWRPGVLSGSHRVGVRARDAAGNQSFENQRFFQIVAPNSGGGGPGGGGSLQGSAPPAPGPPSPPQPAVPARLRALTLRARPLPRRRIAVSGRATLPARVACGGRIDVVVVAVGRHRSLSRRTTLTRRCTYALTIKLPPLKGARRFSVRARFAGTAAIAPKTTRSVAVKL
jgi:hypothetical protein